MLICVVRHGQTDWNKLHKLQGREDIPLNETGLAQARSCGVAISGVRWDGILTSPLSRAKQTAQEIARLVALDDVLEDADLIERDYGSASGQIRLGQVQRLNPLEYEGMEDQASVTTRMMNALDRMVTMWQDKQNVLLVSHGSSINALLAQVSDGQIGTGKTVLENGCMSLLNWDGDTFSILSHNLNADAVRSALWRYAGRKQLPAVDMLLCDLKDSIVATLGENIVGLYLYGSLVWGDFDEKTSDVDLLCTLYRPVTQDELELLRVMHEELAARHPAWDDRVEVQYMCLDGLATFREKATQMANISPGDPLHFVMADNAWLLNWYFARVYGVSLYGASVDILPPITKQEFLQGVYDHAQQWRMYMENTRNSRPYQGYAILTLARALCTLSTGQQVSKKTAHGWAKQSYPEYAHLLDRAWCWCRHPQSDTDYGNTFEKASEFVFFAIEQAQLLRPNAEEHL